jgi:hypothetical protein
MGDAARHLAERPQLLASGLAVAALALLGGVVAYPDGALNLAVVVAQRPGRDPHPALAAVRQHDPELAVGRLTSDGRAERSLGAVEQRAVQIVGPPGLPVVGNIRPGVAGDAEQRPRRRVGEHDVAAGICDEHGVRHLVDDGRLGGGFLPQPGEQGRALGSGEGYDHIVR